jgi:uncharacterized secreted protein with C-terminal beta-propeller domain
MRRAVALLTTFALVGCANTTNRPHFQPALKLISYTSCDDLLSSVRDAAKQSVGPWGFTNGGRFYAEDARGGLAVPAAADGMNKNAAPVQGEDYSGTNTHTAGVEEPDLVQSDGKRLVVVAGGSLHVIDVASKKKTSQIPLEPGTSQLLLLGDRVLVLSQTYPRVIYDVPNAASGKMAYPGFSQPMTTIQLIGLNGVPRVIGETTVTAQFVDARQVGSTARVIVKNTPNIVFPQWKQGDTDDRRMAENRAVIDKAPIEDWLPTIAVNGKKSTLECNDVSRPDTFSGASLVTVLSFDVGASTLTEGDPVALFADGDTVYGTKSSLYIANDQRWFGWRGPLAWERNPHKDTTDLYQFDVTAPKPVYVAGGSVPGWLLNQYSLSEYDGVLRAATTNSPPWQGTPAKSSSTVYTLIRSGGELRQIGQVGGLGHGERIYAVRFVDAVGYVVTFRQTDPLYTLDLSDPRRPKVIGELKIQGYSAYLHPISDKRLIGVGQDATERGRVTGTQISLFDVSNLADPSRLDQFKAPRAYSEAERDPHAFLYWPKTRLLVVPLGQEAVLLRVDDTKLVELGRVSHSQLYQGFIHRSKVIDSALWTISDNGVMVSTLDSGQRVAWINL